MARSIYTPKIIVRFWANVNKEGALPAAAPELGRCWEWTGGGNGRGYGQFRVGDERKATHYVAWELTNGAVPPGQWVLHKCDNRACCNPAHLFLGRKNGEYRRGERSRNHKLTQAQVNEIRARFDAGNVTQSQLAAEFKVSTATIHFIVKRVTWVD